MDERGSGPADAAVTGAHGAGAKRWHGVERSMYEWFPIMDYEACTGCGLCLLTCGNGVFRWSSSGNVPVVADPGSCVLGCTTCGKLCPEDAIKFPDDPKLFVEKAIRENRIYPQVRRELDERLRKYPDHRVIGGVENVGK